MDLTQNAIFQQEIVKNLAKRCFHLKINENIVLRKELYSISGFDAKRFFLRRIRKNLGKCCFQAKMEQNIVFKKEFKKECI